MNTTFPKLTANTLITALTYLLPGMLVFEIIYREGYFTGFQEAFSFTALLIHLLWSVVLSLPFQLLRWLFLRPVKQAKTDHVPGVKAFFILLLVAVFYVFEELMYEGYIDLNIPRDYTRTFMAMSGIFTAIVAFPLGIYFPKLAGIIVAWRERKAGDESGLS